MADADSDRTIRFQRNEAYRRTYQWCDDAGVPLDVTGWTFKFRLNTSTGLGGAPTLQLTGANNGNLSFIAVAGINPGSGIVPGLATVGDVQLYISKADALALPGRTQDPQPYAYNIIATDTAGDDRTVMRGDFILDPAV